MKVATAREASSAPTPASSFELEFSSRSRKACARPIDTYEIAASWSAALETFAAMIVKLHVLDDEQVAVAAESVTEHLDGIGGDLAVLESALAVDLAA